MAMLDCKLQPWEVVQDHMTTITKTTDPQDYSLVVPYGLQVSFMVAYLGLEKGPKNSCQKVSMWILCFFFFFLCFVFSPKFLYFFCVQFVLGYFRLLFMIFSCISLKLIFIPKINGEKNPGYCVGEREIKDYFQFIGVFALSP